MALRTRISLALALWFACEAVAFVLVVEAIGLGGAILLGVVTSMIGASQLKRAGTSALSRLRQGVRAGGGTILQGDLALDDTLAGIGALLLLLPGFVTDALGLLLAVPLLRQQIGGWARRGGFQAVRGKPRGQHGPTTIDLDPEEWRPGDAKPADPVGDFMKRHRGQLGPDHKLDF